MNVLRQIFAITAANLRNVPQRLGNSLVIVIGIAGIVGVLIPVIAMSIGFRSTIVGDARSDRAIVLSRIATDEEISSLSRDQFARIANAPEVRHDARDRPIASGEVVLQAPVSRKRDHSDVSLTLRGVGEQYFALRPELKLVAGRMYESGKQELVVGAAALLQFEGLTIGDSVRLQDGDWTVVGTYSGGNGSRQSEVISDVTTVMSAYKLDGFNSVTVALDRAASFASFRDRIVRDTRRAADAHLETDHAASVSASSSISRMLRIVVYAIGTIMGLGAFFGALNSMYSAVAARAGELATMRALGFSPLAVAVAVLLEALLLALFGALIGIGIASVAFDGATMSTLGGALSGTQLVFSLSVTPTLALGVAILACALGLAGGVVPAVRAARANIAEALRDT
jgi:putative ABC transport system permease protein